MIYALLITIAILLLVMTIHSCNPKVHCRMIPVTLGITLLVALLASLAMWLSTIISLWLW